MKPARGRLQERTGRLVGLGLNRKFLRFLLVGMVNTAFGYVAFLVALQVCPTTFSALVLSTIVAVLFNFVSHGFYVFRHVRISRLWRFVFTYGLVFGYNALGLALLESVGVIPQIGGIVLLPGAVLMSYALNSRFVFVRTAAASAPI